MGSSCVRWTKDTERAFLLALQQTGQVARAAAAIGRSPGVCNQRRRNFPAFAAAWDRTFAEMEAERLADAAEAAGTELSIPPLTRARRDGWTQQRQRSFARALADTGSYGQAAQRVGISMTSVQRLRRRSPEFQAMCDKALIEGGTTVEEAAYVLAVEGWEETIIHGGKVIGHRRHFSDTLTRTLLTQRAGTAGGDAKRCEHGHSTQEEVDRQLIAKFAVLDATRKRQQQRDMIAWADEMARRGVGAVIGG